MDDAGERLQIYGDPEGDHGINRRTLQPPMKHVKVHDPQDAVVRFQFAVSCPHWDHERHGKVRGVSSRWTVYVALLRAMLTRPTTPHIQLG